MNVQEAIEHCNTVLEARKVESARLSAEILVAAATALSRAQVLAHNTRPLIPSEEGQLISMLQRRARHEPIPYITGEVEFYSIPFFITNGILIPRPDTETLVEAALAIAKHLSCPKIYDLGTGCGNIIISLALNLNDGEFWASDISNIAIQEAYQNVRRHDLQNYIELREGSLFAPIRHELTKDFDILVSNPPYVKSTDILKLSPQVREFEPHLALDGGRDGLTFIKTILDGAAPILKPGGFVLIEVDPSQIAAIRTEVRRRSYYTEFTVHKDASDRERVCQFRKR